MMGASLNLYEPGEGVGWIGSIIGAIIVLAVVGMLMRKR